MVRRIIEIILGFVLAISLFVTYSDETHESKMVIWHLLTPGVLKIVVWIILFFAASRLMFGKPKDYSKYFYNLFVKMFGDPKKGGSTK